MSSTNNYPKTLLRQRLEAELEKGPRTQTQLYDLMIPVVPPGKALRTYKRVSEPPAENGVKTRRLLTQDEQIASGARRVVYETLVNMVKYHWATREDVEGETWYEKAVTDEPPSLDDFLPVTRSEFEALEQLVADQGRQIETLRRAGMEWGIVAREWS